MNISLPSWVPIWDAYGGSVIAQLGESIFNAGTQSKTAPQLMKEGKCLKVGGIIFGKLQYCSTAFDEKVKRFKTSGIFIIDSLGPKARYSPAARYPARCRSRHIMGS
jgi:hypothetical protein